MTLYAVYITSDLRMYHARQRVYINECIISVHLVECDRIKIPENCYMIPFMPINVLQQI